MRAAGEAGGLGSGVWAGPTKVSINAKIKLRKTHFPPGKFQCNKNFVPHGIFTPLQGLL